MEWNAQQATALDRVAQWLDGDDQVFRLFGYAGTGKTTLAQHLAAQASGRVLFGAYTGKAASVMRRRGCHGAKTLHSLIYHSRSAGRALIDELEQELARLLHEMRSEDGEEREAHQQAPGVVKLRAELEKAREAAARPSFVLNMDSEVREAELLVVDECSMVDGRMGEDLLSFGTKVLVLGDPAQLPPVAGGGFFTEVDRPDVMLDDIMRQALDNPIVALAARVRAGERLEPGSFGESRVYPRGHRMDPAEAMAHEQMIVGKNATRRTYNQRCRQILERGDWTPEPDDRLICLKNDHGAGFLNGEMWRCVECQPDPENTDNVLMEMTAEDEEEPRTQIALAYACIFRGEKPPPFAWGNGIHEFDYGYAITCHKSQGSQWGSVMVVDESGVFRDDRHRWLYTAITRAADRVTVLL